MSAQPGLVCNGVNLQGRLLGCNALLQVLSQVTCCVQSCSFSGGRNQFKSLVLASMLLSITCTACCCLCSGAACICRCVASVAPAPSLECIVTAAGSEPNLPKKAQNLSISFPLFCDGSLAVVYQPCSPLFSTSDTAPAKQIAIMLVSMNMSWPNFQRPSVIIQSLLTGTFVMNHESVSCYNRQWQGTSAQQRLTCKVCAGVRAQCYKSCVHQQWRSTVCQVSLGYGLHVDHAAFLWVMCMHDALANGSLHEQLKIMHCFAKY